MSTAAAKRRPSPDPRYSHHPIYFVETISSRSGMRWFIEVDRDSNSRDFVIGLMASREVDAVKVLEVIEPCEDFPRGQTLDVTLELQIEASVIAEAA